jgi:diguanylate cyclase (GGDEF)-like protein
MQLLFPRPAKSVRAFLKWLIPRRVALPFRRGVDPKNVLMASAVALGLGFAAATGLLVMHLRIHALIEGGSEIRGLSLLLADQAERAFEAVELVQTGLLERLQTDGVRVPEEFRHRMAGIGVHEDLSSRIQGLPQVEAITAIDADGNLINSSRYWPITPVNVADRDYFKALKAVRELTTFVSDPVQNRANGNWTIYVARKVAGPDGEFLGLLLGAVGLTYFDHLYEAVAPGPGTSLSLFREDGTLLARYPYVAQHIGESFGKRRVSEYIKTGDPGRGVVRQIGLADGLDRLIAGHPLKRYPLIVTASRTVSSLLKDWQDQATYLVGAAVVLEGVIASTALLILRHLRSQRLLEDARAARAEAEAAQLGAEAKLAMAHERERAAREMHIQNVRFGVAMSNMSQSLCMFDSADRLVVANDRISEMFDMSEADILPGTSFDALVAMSRAGSNLLSVDVDTLTSGIRRLKAGGVRGAYVQRLADGRSLAANFQPMEDQGWLLTLEDVTDREQAEAQIRRLAHYDALTGLPNRVLFRERLDEAFARGCRGDASAVLCLDLDRFKSVNDTLGHPLGDALLQGVTARLLKEVRETDTVARLGGDEFAIVQTGVIQPMAATALAIRLIEVLSAPYELNGHQVIIGASIGIALVPGDGTDRDQILKNADLALYRAKADGRGRYRFFELQMDALMQARRLLETDLHKALAGGEFRVFYQPLVNLSSGDISTFEALLRWRHPGRGIMLPAEFVPLAEEIGLIVPLGQWVLQQACADAVTWPGAVKVAVNLSAAQFGSGTLVQEVADALVDSGLDPERLELEITEPAMFDDSERTLLTLHQLHDLGVRIAMDEFGKGYSSLSYLRRFPFDKVKIDRSFVQELGRCGDSEVIVSAVAELCEGLGMTTTAEGVETLEQLRRLRAVRCTEAQGHLFSPARPASEVAPLCRTLSRLEFAEPDDAYRAEYGQDESGGDKTCATTVNGDRDDARNPFKCRKPIDGTASIHDRAAE